MRRKLLLLGGGGHCKSVIDSLLTNNEFSEIGIVEKPGYEEDSILRIPVFGVDGDLPKLYDSGFTDAFVTLGSIGDTSVRRKLFSLITSIGFTIPNIIDSSACVSINSRLGTGIFIGKHAVVNACAIIDDGAIINSAAVVEHDCHVGAFAHIAPGAILGGSVAVGTDTHIGTGVMIRQFVNIGKNTMVGMGSVVLHDVPGGVVAYGNPCEVIRVR